MKIDIAITSCNNNSDYLKMFPIIHNVWKKRFNIDCYLILIDNSIPDILNDYKKYVILFDPIDKVNDIFVAQNIRLLYPCLLKNKNIIITDIDIIPISTDYFINSINNYSNDTFVSFTDRYNKQKMSAICYNVANTEIWKKIFNINNKMDLINLIKKWYVFNNYDGKKNCDGWYNDQLKLYEYLLVYKNNNNKIITLNDKSLNFSRIDKRHRDLEYIVKNSKILIENIEKYTDIHLSKRIWTHAVYQKIILDIVEKLTK